jgi:hypothetical protein
MKLTAYCSVLKSHLLVFEKTPQYEEYVADQIAKQKKSLENGEYVNPKTKGMPLFQLAWNGSTRTSLDAAPPVQKKAPPQPPAPQVATTSVKSFFNKISWNVWKTETTDPPKEDPPITEKSNHTLNSNETQDRAK